MNFFIVLRKEITEQWRTKRLLIVAAVLVLFGLASPLLAKVTPDLLKSIPDMPPGLADLIPAPTLADAVGQYIKNMSQFGILLAVLMSMGVVTQEKERGTAAMMLTHPVSRLTFLLTKFAALGFTFAVSLAAAALGCWYYTLLLFEALPWGTFLALNGLMLIVFLVYVAVTLFCSALARTQGASAGLSFAGLVLVAGIGSVPRIGEYFPGQLFNWGGTLALGGEASNWPALWGSLGLIVISLTAAWLVFRHQET
ncbi:MAG: ABC transporter permease subunit [Chloroflexi bacterium]|nr:ABC transporter permease subunit [Chloroflexota bacterium]